ncbi:sensor histidine kinase [Flaviaesturariibacter amylovorans]|uniref:Signal transduction histidine kinase internal region domain-containing protein n=1 Tax=Flaviaesturariibacter amylovorans TaxID=1084520 RepID=A0ABP8HTI7_9BACT
MSFFPATAFLRHRDRLAEGAFLAVLTVLVPMAIGVQLYTDFSFTASLVLVNLLQVPAIALLYRWFLPHTLMRRRWALFFGGLPVYILIYEVNTRAGSWIVRHLPFVPEGYRGNLASANPDSIPPLLLQNLDYTLLILLSAIGFLFVLESFRRQHTVDQLQADKLRLELEGLKAQVQPHFFFNTLNNLYALSLQGSPKTSVTIANLSGIMRYVLYEAQQAQVLLAKEIAFIHSYLDLERIRHADENAIQFTVQGTPEGRLIEPLLFLPLIENCFKHSLQQGIAGNRVHLVLSISDDELLFQTSNATAPAGSRAEPGGIGLQNVRKRLALLYPGRHALDVADVNGQFTVTLSLQL